MSVESEIIQNYQRILTQIKQIAERAGRSSENFKLLAVSKKQPVASIQKLIDHFPGVLLGENYVQEFADKKLILQGEYQVHLIGPLQSNKVKKAVSLFDVIQSVGTLKTAELIDQEAKKINKIQKIYLQINISADSQKSGFRPTELVAIFKKVQALTNLEILGLMTITKFYPKVDDVKVDFQMMCELKNSLLTEYGLLDLSLSMGMSADYHLAIQAGGDLVRVGTDIFGLRKNE